MRRRATNDFERAAFAQLPKRRWQIAFPFIDKKAPAGGEQLKVKFRQFGEFSSISISLPFARGEVDQKIEMADVTLDQQLVLQHRAQRRRERHGELERHMVVHQPLHHLQKRDVSLRDRFEEPVFLEKMFVLRMPDERQVRVQNEREMTATHAQISYG